MRCRVSMFNYHPDNDAEPWLPNRCLAMDARSDSDIQTFRRHTTIRTSTFTELVLTLCHNCVLRSIYFAPHPGLQFPFIFFLHLGYLLYIPVPSFARSSSWFILRNLFYYSVILDSIKMVYPVLRSSILLCTGCVFTSFVASFLMYYSAV
jgi:hypothetical protein